MLRNWVRRAEIDQGHRSGTIADELWTVFAFWSLRSGACARPVDHGCGPRRTTSPSKAGLLKHCGDRVDSRRMLASSAVLDRSSPVDLGFNFLHLDC